MKSISIVIPAYNESEIISETLSDIVRFFKGDEVDYEIIVVNDCSTDNTAAIVASFPEVTLVHNDKNTGKGFAIKKGVLLASKQWVLFMDADGAVPITNLTAFLPYMNDHDVLIGSKYLNKEVAYQWHRKMVGKIFATIRKVMVGLPYQDTQCGFKLFKTEVAKDLFGQLTIAGWCFDVELLCVAQIRRHSIKEMPIQLSLVIHDSSVHMVKTTLEMLRDLWRIRKKKQNGAYH